MNRNIKTIVVTIFLASFSFYTWFFLFPIFLKNLGAQEKDIALSYTLLTILITSGQYIGGVLSDRWGRKPTITYPTFANAILLFILSLSRSWVFAVTTMCITYFFTSFQIPAYTALVGESLHREQGKAFGLTELSYVLGSAIGPLAGALILKWIDLRLLMKISAFILLFTAVLRLFYLEETSSPLKVKTSIKKLLSSVFILYLLAGIFFYLMDSVTIWGPFLALHMREFLRMDKRNINFLFSAGAFLQAAVSVLAGKLGDRIGHVKSMILGMLAHSVLILLWSFISRGPLSYLLFPISIMFIQFSYISYQVIINLITTRETRGRAIGLFGTLAGLVAAAGPMIGYVLKRNFIPQGAFVGAVLFAVISSIFLVILKNNIRDNIIGL